MISGTAEHRRDNPAERRAEPREPAVRGAERARAPDPQGARAALTVGESHTRAAATRRGNN